MGTRSGNPLWKNNKSGGTPISAEALNRIEDALDTAGGSGRGEVRHAHTTTFDYLGTAPAGTAETTPDWRISRLVTAASGAVTVTVCADGVWTNRESEVYA